MLVGRLCARGAAFRARSVAVCIPSVRASRPLLAARSATNDSKNGSKHPSDSKARILPGVAWGLHYSPPEVPTSAHAPSSETDLPEAHRTVDAIVVLAGGQTGPDSVPAWVERRLDTALSLQRLQRRPVPILSLGEGRAGGGARVLQLCRWSSFVCALHALAAPDVRHMRPTVRAAAQQMPWP